MFRKLATVVSLLLLAFVSACSITEEITVSPEAIIIDVRTFEEYASGHLGGAELLDVTNGQFHAALGELDPAGDYYLYCRSGSRSSHAADLMQQVGFHKVTNLGSVEEASAATGIPIVAE